jgi:hypothetical protein
VYNASAQIDLYYQDDTRQSDERTYALLYKRLREMDVPEWMAPIIYKTTEKPWEYYLDMSRQLWDECRHAMMGEVGLYQDGVPFYKYPISMISSLSVNNDLDPLAAHAALWNIEQTLMHKQTGKRWEWIISKSSDNELAAMFQDYDWADEVLHAQIGRKWLLPYFESIENLKSFVAANTHQWHKYILLSKQEEWWPAFIADIRESRARIKG